MSITVYGSSDDLIEVEGDFEEEFYALGDDENFLGFSNGVVLEIEYTNAGQWRIHPRVHAELVTIVPAADDTYNYSDRATIEGDPEWVIHGKTWASRFNRAETR